MDLKESTTVAINNLFASGIIEKAIADAVQKTVTEVIQSAMRPYSDFGKQLEESVKRALKIHGEIDLPSYNDVILKVVARQVENETGNVIQRQVAERMKDLLQPAPESITLTKLVETYIEQLKEDEHAGCVCYGERGEITLLIKKENSLTYICLDDEPNKTEWKCDIRIGVYKDEVFSLSFQNQDVEKQMFVGPLYHFERMLFQMKAAKSKLLIDADVESIQTTYELVES